MIQSILVPLDGSPFGEQALPLALDLARRAQATLQVVHVHVPIASLYNANEILSDVVLDGTLSEEQIVRLVTARVDQELSRHSNRIPAR